MLVIKDDILQVIILDSSNNKKYTKLPEQWSVHVHVPMMPLNKNMKGVTENLQHSTKNVCK